MSLSSQPIPKYVRQLLQQSREVHQDFHDQLRQVVEAVVDEVLADPNSFLELCTLIRDIERDIESLQFEYLIAADSTYVLERYMQLQCPFTPEIILSAPKKQLRRVMTEEMSALIKDYLFPPPQVPEGLIYDIAEHDAGMDTREFDEMSLPEQIQAILERQPKLPQKDWDVLHAALLDSTMRHQNSIREIDDGVDAFYPLFLSEEESLEDALQWANRTHELIQKWIKQRGKPQELSSWLEHTENLIAPYEEEEEDENVFPLSGSWVDNGEEDWKPLEHPRFEPGTMVKVTEPVIPNASYPDITAEGWHGWVEHALTDGSQNEYVINLDSQTLQSLPAQFIKTSCEAFMTPEATRFQFGEEKLQAVPPREQPEDTRAAQRDICHRYFWGDVEQDNQAARIHRILMRNPAGTDLDNWMDYFAEEVQFPFRARVEGMVLQQIAQGTEVEVVAIEGVDQNGFGLVASIKKGRAILSFPLMELLPAEEEQEEAKALQDYRYWADFMLL